MTHVAMLPLFAAVESVDRDVQALREARFTRVPPLEGALAASTPDPLWETRQLPDSWRRHGLNHTGLGMYRMQFQLEQFPARPWGVYIPFAQSAMSVTLNGQSLAREPAFDAAHVPARASPPHLLDIPQSLLRLGENTLDVRLRVERDLNGGLSELHLGPLAQLHLRRQVQYLWRVELPRALNLACLVAAVFMALLWLRRRQESIYPWFCALALTWGLRATFFTGDWTWLVPEALQVDFGGHSMLVAMSLLLGCSLLVVVLNRFNQRVFPRVEMLLLVLCLLAPLALVPGRSQVLAPVMGGLWALACAVGAVALAVSAQAAWSRRQPGVTFIFAGVLFWWGTLLHEWAMVQGWFEYSPQPLLSYGPPVLLAAMVLGLGGRFFRAFDDAARLNTELEQRVLDKTQELEHHFERITQLERAAAITHERDRLMRDMHDGVGSQLITLQHAIERGKVAGPQAAALVRECVDDLRLVIESLDGAAQALPEALANLRFRMEPRLTAAGVRSRWQIDESPFALAPGAVLQLLRILQEAVSNTLKHAQARQLWVCWQVVTEPDGTGSAAILQISDDGVGLPEASGSAIGPGRGQGNMALRAQRAGATLHVGPRAGGGTDVRVHIAATARVPANH